MGDAVQARAQFDGSRPAGAVLLLAAVMTVVTMAHHPTDAHGGGIGDYVHGAMIVLLSVLFFGFSFFALERGVARIPILAGLIAYAISVFAHIGAATINGFVAPALATRGEVSRDIFLFAWESNQALATLGMYATGAAYVLWSIDLFRRASLLNTATAVAGFLSGVVPVVLLASDAIKLDVSGALVAYATHAFWAALIGLRMTLGKI